MTHANRKRVHLAAVILEDRGACESCWAEIPAGDVAIAFDGGGDQAQARTFCRRCVSGVSLEANGIERFQSRARPITIRIRAKSDGRVIQAIPLRGGCAVVRRRLPSLTRKVDLDEAWVDLAELEEREAAKRRTRKGG